MTPNYCLNGICKCQNRMILYLIMSNFRLRFTEIQFCKTTHSSIHTIKKMQNLHLQCKTH